MLILFCSHESVYTNLEAKRIYIPVVINFQLESFSTLSEIVQIAWSISLSVVFFPVEIRTVHVAVAMSIFMAFKTGDISTELA